MTRSLLLLHEILNLTVIMSRKGVQTRNDTHLLWPQLLEIFNTYVTRDR